MSLPEPTTPEPNPSRQFLSVQYLRAIAAAMIVIFHCGGEMQRLGFAGRWPDRLQSGVDIFFIISGFVMWHSTYRRRMSPFTFFRKRAMRIVPLYWWINTLMLIIFLAAPSVILTGRLVPKDAITSYLFIPEMHPVLHQIYPMLVPGWTLNMEMFFYVIFGLTLLLPAIARIPTTWLCLLVPVVLLHFVAKPPIALQFYGENIVLDFGFGLLLGAFTASNRRMPVPLAWLTLLSGMIAMIAIPQFEPRALTMGLPALAIVGGMVSLEQAGHFRESPLLKQLGDSSYSLYLSHPLTLSAASQLALLAHITVHSTLHAVLLTAAFTVLALIVGFLVYRWVERALASMISRIGYILR